jgi:hypothetical protein
MIEIQKSRMHEERKIKWKQHTVGTALATHAKEATLSPARTPSASERIK